MQKDVTKEVMYILDVVDMKSIFFQTFSTYVEWVE